MSERVPAALAGERLDRVVSMLTELSRSQVEALVAGGRVKLNGEEAPSRSARVAEGDLVEIDLPDEVDQGGVVADPGVEVPVVYADDHIIVVDKPAGLVVHPGGGNKDATLVHGLLARYPEIAGVGGDPSRPGVVHRLDKDTSGLMVVARSGQAYEALVSMMSARDVERNYAALVWGEMEMNRGAIDAPIGRSERRRTRMTVSSGGREARTRYEVRRSFIEPVVVSLLDCQLETGRTHQIRVHLEAVGHPVVGDGWYGGVRENFTVPRLFLHATSLAFRHPVTGEEMSFDSPLPPDLRSVIESLA